MSIAFLNAISTAIGGVTGAVLFERLVESGDPGVLDGDRGGGGGDDEPG